MRKKNRRAGTDAAAGNVTVMKRDTGRFKGIPVILACILFQMMSIGAPLCSGAAFHIEFQEGDLLFRAQRVPVSTVLEGIHREFQVVVYGLEKKAAETVSFEISGKTLQETLKGLLWQLGEKNYAFEFVDDQLKFVTILPESGIQTGALPPSVKPDTGTAIARNVGAIEIVDVVAGSQAETVGFQKGDLILEYDGIRLHRASEMAKETKKRLPHETIETILYRDGYTMKFFVNGGFVGVRIKTVVVSKDLFDD